VVAKNCAGELRGVVELEREPEDDSSEGKRKEGEKMGGFGI